MWTYEQHSGRLLHNGMEIAVGYSGLGEGRNNGALQGVHDIGPIPRGRWQFGHVQCVDHVGPHGPFVIPLIPGAGTDTEGRDGFLCHGDNPEHTASHGCIILPRATREEIVALHDLDLEVIA